LGAGSVTGSNASGVDNHTLGCGAGGGEDVVYSVTPAFTGDLVVSLVNPGSDYDTALAVIAGSCETGAEVACNDDFSSLLSQVQLPVTSGSTYYVVVDGFFGSTGNYELTLHRAGVCEGLGNVVDMTADIDSGWQNVSTSGGVSSLAGTCGGSSAPDGLVTFTAPSTGTMVATTALSGSGYDTLIHVREGNCDSQDVELACNDDETFTFSLQSWISFPVTAGETYYLVVDGWSSSSSGNAQVAVGYDFLGLAGPTPTGSLSACSYGAEVDIYAVPVTAGDSLHVRVDTISATTTGDMYLQILDTDGTTQIGSGDDDFACTYPPPSFSCPETTITVPSTGLVFVVVDSLGSCVDPTNNGYVVDIDVNGVDQELIITNDQ